MQTSSGAEPNMQVSAADQRTQGTSRGGGSAKLGLAALISLVPFAWARRALYGVLMGYRIPSSSRIGWLTVIAVSSFTVGEKVRIGSLNLFKGPIRVNIGDRSRIGRMNRFTCSWHVMQERFRDRRYTPVLTLGVDCLVLDEHYFDLFGEISIGDGSWIAGHASQFWTHGLSVSDRDIHIGRNNYIGSAVRFAPGAAIGDYNIVSLGSVVLSKLDCQKSLIAGFPAKAIRSIEEDVASGKYRFTFEDW
ncbi:MAG TPA: hypothetical protein VHB46_13115 [Burkholderiales bacterium]|nr:hypothetical protein [Burkholderiales bacterium]